jgi:hypothetical protein
VTSATPETARSRAGAAAHLLPLPGGEYSLWRSVCVRSAGFPADVLASLAIPASARAADECIDADRRAELLRVERRRLRAEQRRRRGDGTDDATQPLQACERELADATAAAAAAHAALQRALSADLLRTSQQLRVFASDPRVREAVLWQNRHAIHTAFDPLVRMTERSSGSDRAAKERLVASYLQRYCAKNDSIGFFGPIAWGRLVDAGPPVQMKAGARLISTRTARFESWAIDALARSFDARPALRRHATPRLLPQVRVDGSRLLIPGRDPVGLNAVHASLLRLCDGRSSALEVSRALGNLTGHAASDQEVHGLLEAFTQMGLVTWSLEGPLERDPEQSLRRQLMRVDPPEHRAACLAALDELDACKKAVSNAAGDAVAVDSALDALDATFTRLTTLSPTRKPGQTYAARTLAYQDCQRDVVLDFGPELLARLGAPLSLLLASARWCTAEIGRKYRGELAAAVRRLCPSNGASTADLLAVLAEGFDLGRSGELPPLMADVHSELRRRWLTLLAPSSREQRVQYRSEQLRPAVAAAFGAEAPGWTWARYVSPDLMIAAADTAAIARGEYLVVIGEMHLMNTVLQSALVDEHPDPAEIQAALDADFPDPVVVPVQSRDTFTDRTMIGRRPKHSFWYESARECAPGPRTAVLRTADLVVDSGPDGVWVRARDGRIRIDAVDFLGYTLALRCVSMFGLLPDAPHSPRVSIDDVVVARERWQVSAAALSWAWARTPLERFYGARRWADQEGIPRFTFFRSPVERKPCFLDLDSAVYVDLFAKFVRQAAASGPATIGITEMLPAPDQLWLEDKEGRRYTSELRVVVVDPAAPTLGGRANRGRGE